MPNNEKLIWLCHSSWNFAVNFCELRGKFRGLHGIRGELRGKYFFAKIQFNTV